MEPTSRLELETCRLRNERPGPISFITNLSPFAYFGVIRAHFERNLQRSMQRQNRIRALTARLLS